MAHFLIQFQCTAFVPWLSMKNNLWDSCSIALGTCSIKDIHRKSNLFHSCTIMLCYHLWILPLNYQHTHTHIHVQNFTVNSFKTTRKWIRMSRRMCDDVYDISEDYLEFYHSCKPIGTSWLTLKAFAIEMKFGMLSWKLEC